MSKKQLPAKGYSNRFENRREKDVQTNKHFLIYKGRDFKYLFSNHLLYIAGITSRVINLILIAVKHKGNVKLSLKNTNNKK